MLKCEYNLGNFHTGEIRKTFDKDLVSQYIAIGFKLISVIWVEIKNETKKII